MPEVKTPAERLAEATALKAEIDARSAQLDLDKKLDVFEQLKSIKELLPPEKEPAPAAAGTSAPEKNMYATRSVYAAINKAVPLLARSIHEDVKKNSGGKSAHIYWYSSDIVERYFKYVQTVDKISLLTESYRKMIPDDTRDETSKMYLKNKDMMFVPLALPTLVSAGKFLALGVSTLHSVISEFRTKTTIVGYDVKISDEMFRGLLSSQMIQQARESIEDFSIPDWKDQTISLGGLLGRSTSPLGEALKAFTSVLDGTNLGEEENKSLAESYKKDIESILKDISAVGFDRIAKVERLDELFKSEKDEVYFLSAKIEVSSSSVISKSSNLTLSEEIKVSANVIFSYKIFNESGKLFASRLYHYDDSANIDLDD